VQGRLRTAQTRSSQPAGTSVLACEIAETCWGRLQRKMTSAFARRDQRPYDKHGGRRGMRVPLFKAPQIHLPTQGGTTMYSASSKNKLEAAATVAASLLLAAGPPAALAAIQRHEARLARQSRQTAAHAEGANEDSSPLPA
jgi:hypothetical protein